MALLDQVHITGIRNFPADKKRVVKFQAPLTLIVGENGCGKTTVVECLKYALINEFPDGAQSGKNFVHDPLIDNKQETLAQVKLQCICANQVTVCISKTLLLSAKKGINDDNSGTCKGKDTTISRKDPITGEQRSLGGSPKESVQQICDLLGVSKAILNNVIFCHQESSSWPLDEGKKVKEIFDEIFDATKYNKALDQIKTQEGVIDKKIKVLKEKFSSSSKLKEEADGKKKLIYNTNQKKDQANLELQNITESKKPIVEKLDELHKRERDLSIISSKYNSKKTEKDMVLKNCSELESVIKTLFEGSKSELKSKLDLFKAKVDEKKANQRTHEEEKLKYVHDEAKLQKQINENQMKLGKLERDEETYKKLNDSFKTKLNVISDVLHLENVAKSQYTQQEGEELIGVSQKAIDQFQIEMNLLQQSFNDEENKKQIEIDSLRETKASLESEIKSMQQQISTNKKELTNVTTQINEVNQSQTTLQLLQTKLNRVNSEIEQISKNLNPDQLKSDIETWKIERNDLDDEIAALDSEIHTLQAQTVTLAELKSLKSRKESKCKDIQSLKDKHQALFRTLFLTIPEDNFKITLNEAIHSITFEIDELQKDINMKEKKLYVLEADQKNTSKILKNQQNQLSEFMDKLELVLESKPYAAELERVTNDLKKEQEQVSMMTSTEYMFHRYIDKLESHEPRCPLCKRFFEAEYSVPGLVTELKSKIEKLPEETKIGNSNIERLSKMQSNLLELKPIYENVTKLQEEEIPSSREKLNDIEKEIIEITQNLNELKKKLNIPKGKEKTAQSLQGDLSLLDQNIKELKNVNRELERLESKVSGMGGSGRTLEAASKQQKEKRGQVAELRIKIENNQAQLNNHNEKLQNLQKQKNEIHSKQLTVQGGAGMLKNLEDRKSELEGIDSLYQTLLEELLTKVAPIETQLGLVKNELDSLKKEHLIKLNEERSAIQEYSKQLEEIKRQKQEIEIYNKRGIQSQVAEAKEILNTLNKKTVDVALKRNECEKAISNIKEFIANQTLEEIDLQNNMSLFEKKEMVDNLNKVLENMKKDIDNHDYESLRNERAQLLDKNDSLMRDEARIKGRLQEMEELIRNLEQDLKKDQYKNADQRYLKLAYLKTLSEYMKEDLENFRLTLDNCIVTYHEERMRHVNCVIRDYWTKIYQGNDISKISVKTGSMGGSAKKRVFNYKVMQEKNGIEQEMRNRCSAGQKVLACLIIRLALAETFSRNCGIFALDEPTTNLDFKNSISLSKALATLVQEKSEQKNFQLIIITHDEDFIETLTAIDKAYVVRIFRDRSGLSNVRHPEDDMISIKHGGNDNSYNEKEEAGDYNDEVSHKHKKTKK